MLSELRHLLYPPALFNLQDKKHIPEEANDEMCQSIRERAETQESGKIESNTYLNLDLGVDGPWLAMAGATMRQP